MITLKQIVIKNFLSHADTTIVLNDGDKVLLDGVSGSGKSSIVDALLWALYGVGRVDNKSLIRRGTKEAIVSVNLYDDQEKEHYEIRRTASQTKNTVTVFSGEDPKFLREKGTGGIRDTDAYIAKEILGASRQLFINSVVFPQDSVESFVTATSVRRKELLLEILKTETVVEYAQRTRELLSTKSSTLDLMRGSISTSTNLIKSYEERAADLPSAREYIVELEGDVVATKRELSDAIVNKNGIDAQYSAVRDDELRLDTLKKGVKKLQDIPNPEELIAQLEETIKDEATVRSELMGAVEHNNEIAAATVDIGITRRDYQSEVEAITRRIKSLQDHTLPCPSGDDCPYVKQVEPEIALLMKERDELFVNMEQQDLALKEYERKIDALGPRIDINVLSLRMDEIEGAHVKIKGLREIIEQQEILNEIKRLENSLVSAPSREAVIEADGLVQMLTNKLSTKETKLGAARGEEKYLEQLIEESKNLREQIKEFTEKISVVEEEVALLEELREAFGTTGITALAIDYLLPNLEDKINEVLGMLSDFRVMLSTQKDGAAGNVIEGLFITVKNSQGEVFDFNSYSGGERIRIAVAISEALASMQKCGFRIMDETISGLDDEMIDNFTKVLSKIQSRYSQTICISHIQSVKDLFDKRILTTKINGVSTIDTKSTIS